MLVEQLAKLVATKQNRENDLVYQSLLVDEIISHNSRLVKQRIAKGVIDQTYIQTVKCIQVVETNADECNFDIDDKLLRTKNKVPKPLVLSDGTPFISVYNSINGVLRTQIPYIRPEQLGDIRYRQYTSKDVYYTYENDYIYLVNTLVLNQIGIRSIFDNPFDLPIFSSTCDCDSLESVCIEDNQLVISEVNTSLITSFYSGNAKSEV